MSKATKTYRMKPEAAEKLIGSFRFLGWIFAFPVVLMIAFFLIPNWDQNREPRDYVFLLIPIAMASIIMGVALYAQRRTWRRMQESWASFEIVLSEDTIVRKQLRNPETQIRREEVTHIYQWLGKGLLIRGKSRYQQIYVPNGLQDYGELCDRLKLWGELASATQQRLYWILTIVGSLALSVAHMASSWVKDPRLLILAHAVAALSFVIAFVEVRRSPQVDQDTRRYSWSFLVVAIYEVWAAYDTLRVL